MASEQILGIAIMTVCCFGCAVLFFVIGAWADRSNKPANFWAGTKINVNNVSDLHGYNHACAVMWKIYSIPYWFAGILGCLDFISHGFTIVAAISLFLACFPGLLILIWQYKRIEKAYISQ